MKINYLSVKEGTPASSYWDQTFIEDLLKDLPEGDRTPVLIPGAYQGDLISEINKELLKYPKVLVFVTSDEEGNFDCKKLEHPDMIHYCQYGNCENVFPLGYTPETRKVLKDIGLQTKNIKWFFSGQVTHYRRKMIVDEIKFMSDGKLNQTHGFAKGMDQKEYLTFMSKSKFAFAPPGPISQDSFRLYESLEAGCISIVDRYSPVKEDDYWGKLFPDGKIIVVEDYNNLMFLHRWDLSIANEVFAWWIKKKWEIKEKLKDQLGVKKDDISVIIPTSPIPSHPSTEIIDETIKSIRYHLDSPIFVLIDGVRKEQENMKGSYEEYIQKLLWKCNFEYENVIPVFFPQHKHQSGMMKGILPQIETPLLLFVEHDTPLVTDEPIEWDFLKKSILSGKAHAIRLHYEAVIPEEHKHLMIGEVEDKLLKTAQWSQRPHLARTDFYKEIMKFFSEESNCFIEDLLHGKLQDAWKDGKWDNWKVFIYCPDEKNIKRSLNLDGRKEDRKYDDRQVW